MVVQSKKHKADVLGIGKPADDLPPKLVARLERLKEQNARIEEEQLARFEGIKEQLAARIEEHNVRLEEKLDTIVQVIAQRVSQSNLEQPLESIIRPSDSEASNEEEEEGILSNDEITVVDKLTHGRSAIRSFENTEWFMGIATFHDIIKRTLS